VSIKKQRAVIKGLCGLACKKEDWEKMKATKSDYNHYIEYMVTFFKLLQTLSGDNNKRIRSIAYWLKRCVPPTVDIVYAMVMGCDSGYREFTMIYDGSDLVGSVIHVLEEIRRINTNAGSKKDPSRCPITMPNIFELSQRFTNYLIKPEQKKCMNGYESLKRPKVGTFEAELEKRCPYLNAAKELRAERKRKLNSKEAGLIGYPYRRPKKTLSAFEPCEQCFKPIWRTKTALFSTGRHFCVRCEMFICSDPSCFLKAKSKARWGNMKEDETVCKKCFADVHPVLPENQETEQPQESGINTMCTGTVYPRDHRNGEMVEIRPLTTCSRRRLHRFTKSRRRDRTNEPTIQSTNQRRRIQFEHLN